MVRRRSFINPLIFFKNKTIYYNSSLYFKLFVTKSSSITHMNRHKLSLRKKLSRFFFNFYIYSLSSREFMINKNFKKYLILKSFSQNTICFYDFFINKTSLLGYIQFNMYTFIFYGFNLIRFYFFKFTSIYNNYYITSRFLNSQANIKQLSTTLTTFTFLKTPTILNLQLLKLFTNYPLFFINYLPPNNLTNLINFYVTSVHYFVNYFVF